MSDRVILAALGNAPEFTLGVLRVRSLAVPSRGSTELAAWRVDLPAGGTSGLHAIDHEQVIVVNEGSITAYVEGAATAAVAGDALILPTGKLLELRNETASTASATVISLVGFTATAGGHTFTPPWAR